MTRSIRHKRWAIAAGIMLMLSQLPQHSAQARSLSAPAGSTGAADAFTSCITFEDLPLGQSTPYGGTLTSGGLTLQVGPDSTSTQASGGYVLASDLTSEMSGKELYLVDANVRVSLSPIAPGGVSIRFLQIAIPIDLVINGSRINSQLASNLDGATVNGVNIAVYSFGNRGRIVLSGTVNSLQIGGPYFLIDDICPLPAPLPQLYRDLGDAPDSIDNHHGIANTAYPGVSGNFPTVYEGAVAGPVHNNPYEAFLGMSVSGELGADQNTDLDGANNILNGGADNSNNDGRDDGWLNRRARFRNCEETDLTVRVSRSPTGTLSSLYLNAWIDGNRDGDWADGSICAARLDAPRTSEWIVRNQVVDLTGIMPGSYNDFTFTSVPVFNTTEGQSHWVRFTLSEAPATTPPPSGGIEGPVVSQEPDGRGPNTPGQFAYGETEDYLQPALGDQPLPGTVAISKTAITPANVSGGDSMLYRIDIGVSGGQLASDVAMRDRLPPGVDFLGPITVNPIAGVVTGTTASYMSGTVSYDGTLAPDARVRVSFPVRIEPCFGPAQTITNTARVRDMDGNTASNTHAVSVQCAQPPDVDVQKQAYVINDAAPAPSDDLAVLPGDDVAFRFTVRNNAATTATVFISDTLPDGAVFVGTADPDTFKTSLILAAGQTREVDVRARLLMRCGVGANDDTLTNTATYKAVAGAYAAPRGLPAGWPREESNPARLRMHCDDLGDAPDSSNHFGQPMNAYPGVQANFPSVFDPATGADQGPKHRVPYPLHLGRQVSPERDADVLPDQDGIRNITPPANVPDKDDHDDGVQMSRIALADCAVATFPVQIAIGPNLAAFLAQYGAGTTAYLNVWADGNRDGDWADVKPCNGQPAFEHLVIDRPINLPALGPGLHVISVTTGLAYWPANLADKPAWMRFTLSERPSNKPFAQGATQFGDGRGFPLAFATGETEDRLWRAREDAANGPDLVIRKRGAMRTDSGGPITGTTSADDVVVWQIEYANRGNSDASGVVITDDLVQAGNKAGLKITTVPSVPYTLSGNALTFNVGSLPAGASGNVIVELMRHVDQRFYTNTVSITGTADIDTSNNSAVAEVKHNFLTPPLLLNPLDGTTCDGDFTGSRTILGITTAGATVDLYIDGVLVSTQVAGGAGYFRYETVLPDGVHTLYAVARTANREAVGDARTIIVNSALSWDPLSLRFISPAGLRYRPMDADGRTDETGWSPHLAANTTYTVSVRVCCTAGAAIVTMDIGGTPVALIDPDGDSVYEGPYTTPGTGANALTFALSVSCGSATGGSNGDVLIDPDGTVRDALTGAPIGGASVMCLQQTGAGYSVWPAGDFGQSNPLSTNASGYFAFFTPAGTYRLDVSKAGYQPYRSPDLRVESAPVRHDVNLTPIVNEPAQLTIVVDENGFTPALATVAPGTVVAFVNGDISDHVVTSTASTLAANGFSATSSEAGAAVGFSSGALGAGQRYVVKLGGNASYTISDPANPNAGATITVGSGASRKVLLPLVQR